MTGFDDELDHVCAWGRWRSGDALNDATLAPDPGRDPGRPRVPSGAAVPLARRSRGTRRLRLVADRGAPTAVLRPVR